MKYSGFITCCGICHCSRALTELISLDREYRETRGNKIMKYGKKEREKKREG